MKRGGSLNRSRLKSGKPLERGKPLRPDPAKVQAFLRKHGGIKRKPAPARPVEGPLSPAEWRKRVFDASGGRCIITGARARDVEDRRFHAHHVLSKRELRARRLHRYVWDARNGVVLRADVHERHENAFERVPHTALPGAVWEFCAELDALDGTSWATSLVLRLHPVRGARERSR